MVSGNLGLWRDMAESKMMNFRLRNEDIPKLDAAAKKMNMSRSDFIRAAVSEHVARVTQHKGKLEAAPHRGEAKKAQPGTKKFPDCPKNPACSFRKELTGIKICTTCGVKTA